MWATSKKLGLGEMSKKGCWGQEFVSVEKHGSRAYSSVSPEEERTSTVPSAEALGHPPPAPAECCRRTKACLLSVSGFRSSCRGFFGVIASVSLCSRGISRGSADEHEHYVHLIK